MKKHAYAFLFLKPVNPADYPNGELNDYFDIIKQPMDYSEVQVYWQLM